MNSKPQTEAPANGNGRTLALAGAPKDIDMRPRERNARRAQSSKAGRSKSEKLACRYCGSDDLAPSFQKRRDARCRACFKRRYRASAKRKPGRMRATKKEAKE